MSIEAPRGPARIARAGQRTVAPAGLGLIRNGAASTPRSPAPTNNAAPSLGGGAWTSLGPKPITQNGTYGNVSGRVSAIAVDPNNHSVIYAGTAGGGVWKTSDGGVTWTPLTDSLPNLVIGALAIDSTGQTIYMATGDRDGGTLAGSGAFRSTDGGANWVQSVSLGGFEVGSLAIDSTTSPGPTQRALAATDQGLYISSDEGYSFSQNTQINSAIQPVLGKTASGALFQVVQDPSVPSRFWATAADYCSTEAGTVLVSTDGGNNWADSGAFGSLSQAASRVAIGVGPAGVVYAVSAACGPNATDCPSCTFGSLYDIEKLTVPGTSPPWAWSKAANPNPDYLSFPPPNVGAQGWYDNVVAVDPSNANHVVFGGIDLLASKDGAATFTNIAHVYSNGPVHPDQHVVTFLGPDKFLLGNDGGVYETADLGGTGTSSDWTNLNATLATSEFYGGSALDLAHMVGGAQDNESPGTFAGVAGNPTLPAWNSYGLGDGGYTAIDPTSGSNLIYFESSSGYLAQGDRTNPAAHALADPCDGQQTTPACNDNVDFIAPFLMDPANPQHLVFATTKVYQSTTGGLPSGTAGWPTVSPIALTKTGFPKDAISAMAMTPGGSTIVTGSIAGVVWRTNNGGSSWTDVTGNLPPFTSASDFQPWISGVAINPSNANELWVAIGRDGAGDVWHTTNANLGAGTTWSDLRGFGATSLFSSPVFTIALDPLDPSIVYAGTSHGAYVCTTCGGSTPAPAWSPLGSGLPNVAVKQLTLTHDGTSLIAWTHGRGVYSLAIGSLPMREALPAMANAAYGGYTTVTYVENIGTGIATTAHVVIHYFDSAGNAVGIGDANPALPAHATWTVRQDNGDSFAPGGAGSALVYSDQPVAVFVNEFAPGGADATSYSGIPVTSGAASTIYAPAIANNAYGGYTTGIGLVNLGATTANVTVTYRDTSGTVKAVQQVNGFAPSAYRGLYSGDASLALPNHFSGTATITSDGGQPLAAVVNETGPGKQFSSYDAVATGVSTLYAPVALRNAFGGYNTGFGVQNISGTPGNVSVTYYDSSGNPTTTTAGIAAHGYLGIYQGTDIPADGAYTAVISAATPGVMLAAIVNEVASVTNPAAQQSTSYNTFTSGSLVTNLALVTNASPDGWSTGEGIMNTGSASTTVTVTYFDASTGLPVGTPQTQPLAPNAFWGVYQPTAGLPAGGRATAVVSTSGGQVAVICNENSASSFMSYGGQ